MFNQTWVSDLILRGLACWQALCTTRGVGTGMGMGARAPSPYILGASRCPHKNHVYIIPIIFIVLCVCKQMCPHKKKMFTMHLSCLFHCFYACIFHFGCSPPPPRPPVEKVMTFFFCLSACSARMWGPSLGEDLFLFASSKYCSPPTERWGPPPLPQLEKSYLAILPEAWKNIILFESNGSIFIWYTNWNWFQ